MASSAPREAEGCGNWWDGWLQTAKEKSVAALEMVRKDLSEFGCTMQKDTGHAVEITSQTLKESLKAENTSAAKDKMYKGLNSFLDGISRVLTVPPDDDDQIPITNSTAAEMFDRGKARLHAIQVDADTYLQEPSGSPEAFNHWKAEFDLEAVKGDISELLVSKVEVRALYTRLVPAQVSHVDFWQHYFYRLHQIKVDEARKEALMKRAEHARSDDSLSWEVDWSGDEDDDNASDWERLPESGEGSKMKIMTSVEKNREISKEKSIHTPLTKIKNAESIFAASTDEVKILTSPTVMAQESLDLVAREKSPIQSSEGFVNTHVPVIFETLASTPGDTLPAELSESKLGDTFPSSDVLADVSAVEQISSSPMQDSCERRKPDDTLASTIAPESTVHQVAQHILQESQAINSSTTSCEPDIQEEDSHISSTISENKNISSEVAVPSFNTKNSVEINVEEATALDETVRAGNITPLIILTPSINADSSSSFDVSSSVPYVEESPNLSARPESSVPHVTESHILPVRPESSSVPVPGAQATSAPTDQILSLKLEESQKELKTRDKGDLVVVGSSHGSPVSATTSASDSKDADDEWDLDLDLTEEDMKAAEELAKKLGQNLDTEEDWENWE